MAVSWDLNRGLAGMFGQWSKDNAKARDDQREFERQEKIAQAGMKRDQEMYNWKARRDAEAKEQQDALTRAQMQKAGYSEEEITGHLTGAGQTFATKLDQEKQLATAKTDAAMQAEQKALDEKYKRMHPELTDAERQAKVAEDMRRSQMTAAEKNEEAVMEILNKYQDQENPQYSATDKAKLAIYGVKVGNDKPEPPSQEVKQKYWDASRKEAVAKWDPDKVTDAEAINAVQAAFANAGKEAPKMTGESARKWLIDRDAFNGYSTAIKTVTGMLPDSTPTGQPIDPPAAAAAVAEVTGEKPEPSVQPEPHKPGQALATVPEGTHTMPETAMTGIGSGNYSGSPMSSGPQTAAPPVILPREPGESNADYQRRIREARLQQNIPR